ncbi:MAG: hypothetical protein K0U93_23695 [Gammaproteobacteria bacterium]|nr:hypothetical protein [Gammaproteobacteria bacterium]
MSLTLMSPKGSAKQDARVMAPRIADFSGLRIGLLSNGKLNADLLLTETAACFEREHQCSVSELLDKGNASKPAETERLEQLAASSDFLITANGD